MVFDVARALILKNKSHSHFYLAYNIITNAGICNRTSQKKTRKERHGFSSMLHALHGSNGKNPNRGQKKKWSPDWNFSAEKGHACRHDRVSIEYLLP